MVTVLSTLVLKSEEVCEPSQSTMGNLANSLFWMRGCTAATQKQAAARGCQVLTPGPTGADSCLTRGSPKRRWAGGPGPPQQSLGHSGPVAILWFPTLAGKTRGSLTLKKLLVLPVSEPQILNSYFIYADFLVIRNPVEGRACRGLVKTLHRVNHRARWRAGKLPLPSVSAPFPGKRARTKSPRIGEEQVKLQGRHADP